MSGTNRRTISASEIAAYLYCARSWAYQRQGQPSANTQELARGEIAHQQHGRQAGLAAGLSRFALLLFILAILSLLFLLLR